MRTQREGGLYWTISVDFLSFSLSFSFSGHWVDPWNQTSNSGLSFLLRTKIFIRTIRSSDKASTEGWGPCIREGRMCQQDVFTATLYTPTTGLLSSIWDTAVTLFAPSQARWHHASRPRLTPPILTPSQQALLCPSPWAVGLGCTACVLGRGGARASWFLSRKLGLVSDHKTHKVSEDHRGWVHNIRFNKLYHNLHGSSVTISEFWKMSVRPISQSLSHGLWQVCSWSWICIFILNVNSKL